MKFQLQSLLAIAAVLAATELAHAKSKSKKPYNAAKKECLTEDSSLKGKDLQKCISHKRK